MLRILLAVMMIVALMGTANAQGLPPLDGLMPKGQDIDRTDTGGATTLEDILRRQEGQIIDQSYRRENVGTGNPIYGITEQLGVLGGTSDSDVYRALRYNTADVTVSSRAPAANVIIQDGGMIWMQARTGDLNTYGAFMMIGTFLVLCAFYLFRGRVMIDGEKTGRRILRFTTFERFGHWLFAGSFIILGATGMILLFGRNGLIPFMGHEAYSTLAIGAKWVHNNMSWAFMLGLVIITVNWIAHNIPNRHDIKWVMQAGGLFSKNLHPPARKFNAGQKMIFWCCVAIGTSISLTGLSLLFPFQIQLFGPFIDFVRGLGITSVMGVIPLPSVLLPHEEMQIAQVWHVLNAFFFIAIITAHIYIGSVGMEGASDAMTSGEVELQWAREHHNLWVKEVEDAERAAADKGGQATPAE